MRVLFTTLVLVVLVATTSAQQSGLHADAADVNDVWSGAGADAKAFEEMVKGAGGRRRQWTRPPDLIVITSVLQFDGVLKEDYTAHEEVIDKTEADEMSQDLTAALGVLTAHKFDRFASIAFERAEAGARARVVRDGYIVVARFRGVREALDGVGYGGRMTMPDGTITSGTMMLDSDYDRTDHLRRLLRA